MPTFSVNNVLKHYITHYNRDSYISSMRCIYKVLFTRVHPGAEKVNTLSKCSPRCSPFGNLRLKVLVYSMSYEAEHQAEY